MDMNKTLKNINNLNEYVLASRDVSEEIKNVRIQFNMSTVLALKKIRSYEIEYFNKYEENGIACTALERLLDMAPSKTWGVLGKEIVNLLQYWLDAIRKHLISHSPHWWTFLRLLLKFMKEVRLKDPSVPNHLVEQTAECLLDLGTNEKADAFQKHEILHCLNMYCAESNREIRFALRNRLGVYFTKLSTYISTCGHFPCQLSVVETLLRWLVPRHDPILRANSADKWFPQTMYSKDAVDVFLTRPWINFFQDARDFLNIHNRASGLIVSVICRSLSIGKIVVISGNEKHTSWLDINSKGKCMSVVLDPQLLATFGHNNLKSWETLLISEHNTQAATLARESHKLTISTKTIQAPQAIPSLIKITEEPSNDVKIVVSSKSDLTALDKALNGVFGDKYQLVLNLEAENNLSPDTSSQNSRRYNTYSEEDIRFSHPVAGRRGKRSGYIVKSRNPWRSPSTASTSSLAQLHDRLAALPTYKYDKEPVSVCVRPELSSVTEVSETDERRSFHSATTLKLRTYGVCHRGISKTSKPKNDNDDSKKVRRGLSPAIREEAAPSCLLVATIGSNDDSVLNNTMERLAQNKDFESKNIVDLLIKEALEDKPENQLGENIDTGNNKNTKQEESYEAIENTPNADSLPKVSRQKGCTVVSKSTSDESNTEEIGGTPLNYVNTRRRKTILKKKVDEGSSKDVDTDGFDAQAVEAFFSQHFAENTAGDIIISPTLAKKINDSSSESSDSFDEHIIIDVNKNMMLDDNTEVMECLSSIVDKVCQDLDKYTDYLSAQNDTSSLVHEVQEPLAMESEVQGTDKRMSNPITPRKSESKPNKSVKLKYKITPKIKRAKKKVANKRENISPIIEEVISVQNYEEDNAPIATTSTNNKTKKTMELKSKNNKIDDKSVGEGQNNSILEIQEMNKANAKPDLINDIVPHIDTPLIRRKRKLYSPKAETNNEKVLTNPSEIDDTTESNTTKVKTRKSSSTFYTEIENERKKQTLKSRRRKSKIPEPDSPRTLKMNQVFDKLKKTVDSNEKITLADKTTANIAVYNFSSDSEEEYFKKKKIVAKNRPSVTTMGSFESAISTRRGRITKKVNYTENISSNDEGPKPGLKPTKAVKKYKSKKRKPSTEVSKSLEDERMRQVPQETLNSSIIVENTAEVTYSEVGPVLTKAPQLEIIVDADQTIEDKHIKNKSVKKNKKLELSLKKGNTSKANSIDIAKDDSTESPLPGLVVETTTACVEDNNDSVTGTMLQKFKKFYHDGFDACVNDTNTTQNLLSDVEKNNYSPNKNTYKGRNEETQRNNSLSRTEKRLSNKEEESSVKLKRKASDKFDFSREREPKLHKNIVNVSKTIETKSEKSIASQSINAHGDMDENPPSPTMIEQQVYPRNLELEYVEQSMRDYFDNLRRQITDCNSRNKSNENLHHSSGTHKSDGQSQDSKSDRKKSAKVLVTRISEEEINNWISSGKSNSIKGSRKSQQTKHPRHKTYNFEKEKSPVVSVTRLSSEEIEKWLPSCNSSVHNTCNSKVKNKSKASNKLDILYEAHKWLPSRRNSSSDVESERHPQLDATTSMRKLFKNKTESLSKLSNSTSNEVLTRSKIEENEDLLNDDSRTKLNRLFSHIDNLLSNQFHDSNNDNKNKLNKPKGKENDRKSDIQRGSVISPIKIGNFLSQTNRRTIIEPDEDEYVKRVKNIFSEGERSITTKKKRYLETKAMDDEDSSPVSTSTKIELCGPTKRKSASRSNETKKQKIEIHDGSVSESGPSLSSVAEWFRRNEPTCSRDETTQTSLVDCVQSIAEKLDTTLVNIHQNTSNKLVDLFVDAQKQLEEHKERRRAMYRDAASRMLAQIVNIMDQQFSELDMRSQEMDDSFMEQLRSRASQMILEDSKQKQAMVQIMKEDVQAVVEFINNNAK